MWSQAEQRQKDESRNTWVVPKGSTPMFPAFHVFFPESTLFSFTLFQYPPFQRCWILTVWPSYVRGKPQIQAMHGSDLLRISYKIIYQRRNCFFVLWIDFWFTYFFLFHLWIIYNCVLILFFLSLSIVKQLGLRMSNYNDSKKIWI